MSEFVSPKSTLRDGTNKQIDKLAGIIEHLRSTGTTFDDSLAIGFLVASIDLLELDPVTAASKTLSDKSINCEAVRERLTDEARYF